MHGVCKTVTGGDEGQEAHWQMSALRGTGYIFWIALILGGMRGQRLTACIGCRDRKHGNKREAAPTVHPAD